jgi:hypothetical protein
MEVNVLERSGVNTSILISRIIHYTVKRMELKEKEHISGE